MDNCAIIAGRIKEVLKHKKTSAKKMLEDLGLNPQYLVQMKKAMSPQIGTLQRMADYLGVPLDYLLYGTVDRPTPISAREEELIRIVSQMTDEQRESLLVLLRAMQDGKH